MYHYSVHRLNFRRSFSEGGPRDLLKKSRIDGKSVIKLISRGGAHTRVFELVGDVFNPFIQDTHKLEDSRMGATPVHDFSSIEFINPYFFNSFSQPAFSIIQLQNKTSPLLP